MSKHGGGSVRAALILVLSTCHTGTRHRSQRAGIDMCPPSFFGSCFASKMDEFEEQLAETVKNYSHLYNCANKPYKDSEMAKNSWKEIAQLLCTDEIVCRKRWRSLRDKFAKAKRRVQSRKRSPGGKKIAIPALYTALQWLDVHVKNRQTTTSMMSVSHGEVSSHVRQTTRQFPGRQLPTAPPEYLVWWVKCRELISLLYGHIQR